MAHNVGFATFLHGARDQATRRRGPFAFGRMPQELADPRPAPDRDDRDEDEEDED